MTDDDRFLAGFLGGCMGLLGVAIFGDHSGWTWLLLAAGVVLGVLVAWRRRVVRERQSWARGEERPNLYLIPVEEWREHEAKRITSTRRFPA